MSGVKGLLARFENANLTAASAPPERGRSPAESLGAGSNGTSPRPLSKVRTSFITVESKSGQMGLRRDTSGEPTASKRRTSFSINEEDAKPLADRKQVAEDTQAKKPVSKTIPEAAAEMNEAEKPITRGREPARPKDPVKVKHEEKKQVAVKKEASHANTASKPVAKVEPAKVSSSRSTTKPAPISTAKTTIPSRSSPKKAKSPLPKTPTTPKAVQPKKTAEKQPEKKPSRASLAPNQTKTPTKPINPEAPGSALKLRIGESPPQSGFNKPKPRSPTRPVKLPASLTAHTASSGSKTATAPTQRTESRHSSSRASVHPPQVTNSLKAHQALSRSPSRVSTTSAMNPLARKPPTLNKASSSRPSLGPPPVSQLKKQSSRQSLPAAADETFLARMMRSTASSASKTAEKGPVTPPKKTQPVKRPVAKQVPAKAELPIREKKEVVKSVPPVAKGKAVAGSASRGIKSGAKKTKAPVQEVKEVSSEAPAPSATPAPKEEVINLTTEAEEIEAQHDDALPSNETASSEAAKTEDGDSLPHAVAEAESSPKEIEETETQVLDGGEEEVGTQVLDDGDEEVEIESETVLTPTESVDEALPASAAAVEDAVEDAVASEPEPEPVEETKEEPVETQEAVPSSPITETNETKPEPASEEPEATIEADSTVVAAPAVEVRSAIPPTLNFFNEHHEMWGRNKPRVELNQSEDAEDAKAREEIAKLNAALMAGELSKHDDDVE